MYEEKYEDISKVPEFTLAEDGVKYVDIKEWIGYKIGSDGSVFCCRKLGCKRGFDVWRKLKWQFLNKSGRPYISLSNGRENGRHIKKLKTIYRLVLENFVGPCPDGLEACHNDDNLLNNNLTNLRWDTHDSNVKDKIKHGRVRSGEQHPQSILSVEQVIKIKTMIKEGKREVDICNDMNLKRYLVHDIKSGRNWKHITL